MTQNKLAESMSKNKALRADCDKKWLWTLSTSLFTTPACSMCAYRK